LWNQEEQNKTKSFHNATIGLYFQLIKMHITYLLHYKSDYFLFSLKGYILLFVFIYLKEIAIHSCSSIVIWGN